MSGISGEKRRRKSQNMKIKDVVIILFTLPVIFIFSSCKDRQFQSDTYDLIKLNNLKSLNEKCSENSNVINSVDGLNRTPLHWAALLGENEKLTYLIRRGANVNSKDNYGITPLHNASVIGNDIAVNVLVTQVANVNAQSKALSHITKTKTGTTTTGIRIKGAYKSEDLGRKPYQSQGGTPLHSAAWHGHSSVVHFLIDNGADFKIKDFSEFTVLCTAVKSGSYETVQLLIQRGADVNSINSGGQTPLHFSVKGNYVNYELSNRLKIVELLLNQGANIEIVDRYGRTPLYSATNSYGVTDIVKLLLEKGADVNVHDVLGYTPLHWSIVTRRIDMAELLVANNANVNAVDDDGRNVLHIIAKGENLTRGEPIEQLSQLVELLIKKGADIHHKDNNGSTPIDIANVQGISERIELFKKFTMLNNRQ